MNPMKNQPPRKRIAPYIPVRNVRVVLRVPEILRICRGRKTLHLGCADMPRTLEMGNDLLHVKLANVTNPGELWGVDSSEEGCRSLRKMGFNRVIHGDLERAILGLPQRYFEILLAGELIEHLANPGLFLKNVASLMSGKTELIITTPNAFSFKGFIYSMTRREKVHHDHLFYFSYQTLKQFLDKFGLRCIEIYYYQNLEEQGLSKSFDKAVFLMIRISPLWADGIIARVDYRES
jgi:hypothetical protein